MATSKDVVDRDIKFFQLLVSVPSGDTGDSVIQNAEDLQPILSPFLGLKLHKEDNYYPSPDGQFVGMSIESGSSANGKLKFPLNGMAVRGRTKALPSLLEEGGINPLLAKGLVEISHFVIFKHDYKLPTGATRTAFIVGMEFNFHGPRHTALSRCILKRIGAGVGNAQVIPLVTKDFEEKLEKASTHVSMLEFSVKTAALKELRAKSNTTNKFLRGLEAFEEFGHDEIQVKLIRKQDKKRHWLDILNIRSLVKAVFAKDEGAGVVKLRTKSFPESAEDGLGPSFEADFMREHLVGTASSVSTEPNSNRVVADQMYDAVRSQYRQFVRRIDEILSA